MKELDVAIDACRTGGAIIRKYYNEGVTMRSKESWNLVSDADLESEQAVVSVIRGTFPDHAILGEESHKDSIDSEHLWIVDPLDGTNNFAHHIPHFAVAIAYAHKGELIAAAIYNPIRDELFTATKGGGAFFNGDKVEVSQATELKQSVVCTGFFYDRGEMMEATLNAIRACFQNDIHGIRRLGAASLDLVYVGLGRFEAFFEYALEPWDHTAGTLFVREAGGKVTDGHGESLGFERSSVLSSNGHVHGAMLEIVKKHHPSAS